MRKPSYGISGCEVAARAVKSAALLSVLLLTFQAGARGVTETPEPQNRVFELRRPHAGEEAALQVGDILPLELVGNDEKLFALTLPTGELANAVSDAGWQLLEGPSPGSLIAVPLKAGAITLPSLPVAEAKGTPAGVTIPLSLQVSSAIAKDDPKPSEPAPLRPPSRVRLPGWVWMVTVGLALLVLALITWGLVRLSRKNRDNQMPLPVVPEKILPEDVVALESLNAIAAADWISKGAFKTHYFGISEVLKTYFGARYSFDALESTTAELLQALDARSATGDAVLDRVEKLFDRLDLVKFTDHVPQTGEGAVVLEEARTLVRLTRRPLAEGGPP